MDYQLTLSPSYSDGLDEEWAHLANAGTWWTGAERVAIAAVARAARNGDPIPVTELSSAATNAAERLANDRHADAEWVQGLVDDDLSNEAYVELLGIVARLSAVDSFLYGLGNAPKALPTAVSGEPPRELVPEAEDNGGLVPTVGQASAPNALSAVTAETDAMLALHGVLYLSIDEMADLAVVKALNRPQMELVAARVSYLNDCYF